MTHVFNSGLTSKISSSGLRPWLWAARAQKQVTQGLWPKRIVNDDDEDDDDDDGANPLQWLAEETIQSNRKGLVAPILSSHLHVI